MNSDQSDVSTSGSDEEFEFEQHEYERRRELYLSKIIFCERKYQEMKPTLLKLRLDQIEKLQDSTLNRKSDIYLTRKAILDNEFEAKRNHIKIIRELRLEALKRRVVGDRWDAMVNFKNNKLLAKESIQESIHLKYEKLLTEQREVEKLTGFSESFSGDEEIHPVSVNLIEKYIRKRNTKGDPLWCDIPILIAQLPSYKITEDLNILFKANEKISQKC